MNKSFLITAALLGALSVILGAFGAHGLKSKMPADALEIFETSVRYQFYHVFALVSCWNISTIFSGKFNYLERQIIYCRHYFILRLTIFAYLF